MLQEQKRVEIVDVLRGFAIMGICLIHMIEHFNFYAFPEVINPLLKFSDKVIWEAVFFTFSGKAYAIFALLFGFTFFIQDNNQRMKGKDFRLRFLWRMVILFFLGAIDGIFFTGEILLYYSVMALVLLPVARLSNKTVFIIAVIFMLQPAEWGKLIYALAHPDFVPGMTKTEFYFTKLAEFQKNGTFLEMMKVNLVEGQLANFAYAWEFGRIFQTASLFMLGMLLGRSGYLNYSEKNISLWRKLLVIAIICFFPLMGLASIFPEFIQNNAIMTPLRTILESLAKFSFMVFLVSLIVNLYYTTSWRRILDKLAPYGKMTLTIYMTQSVVGSFLFYNWGLALWNDLCITHSFLIGIAFFILQLFFATWWMKRYKHGPMESIWRKLTWIGVKK